MKSNLSPCTCLALTQSQRDLTHADSQVSAGPGICQVHKPHHHIRHLRLYKGVSTHESLQKNQKSILAILKFSA